MPREATPRQLEVLRTIAQLMRRHGVPPTNRELADALGMTSSHGIWCHLFALDIKGLIRTGRKAQPRALRITEDGLEELGLNCPYCEEAAHAE